MLFYTLGGERFHFKPQVLIFIYSLYFLYGNIGEQGRGEERWKQRRKEGRREKGRKERRRATRDCTQGWYALWSLC